MPRILVATLALFVSVAGTAAWGQDTWPAKPVRLIVPSSPGGGTDVFARLLAQALSDSLKQPFVVENRPGASGNIGSEAVAREAPTSFSVMAPAKVPTTIVQRMAAEVGKALKAIAPRLDQQALVPVYDTPEQFATSLKVERASWAQVIQRQGITADQ